VNQPQIADAKQQQCGSTPGSDEEALDRGLGLARGRRGSDTGGRRGGGRGRAGDPQTEAREGLAGCACFPVPMLDVPIKELKSLGNLICSQGRQPEFLLGEKTVVGCNRGR
jgi:hypothetical protein